MAQVGNDCYFFYYSSCKKGRACPFRHSAPALGKEDVCQDWAKGSCIVPNCARRHMGIHKDRGSMPCYWESQRVGCTKPFCPFKHLKPRPDAPLQTGQVQPTTTASQGNPVKGGQRSATIRTIGKSQKRLRHARTQGVATDSTAADSRMDMRRATRAMSRYHWVHARDQLNQQHRSETARRGPGPLLPMKRTASVQQEDQTKPLAKRRRTEPVAVPVSPQPSTAAGLRIKSLDEILAEKRKHHATVSDSTVSAEDTCQRRPADSTSKESPSVVSSSASKNVRSPVLNTAPTKSSTPATPPAKITRLSSHSSAKKESPATKKVSQSEGSEVTSTADTTTMKSDAKSEFDWLDDIDLLDDDAFEKAMREFVGDVTYVDLNKPDLDETVNSNDLLLEAELMI
ncbi:zinc finger CCCH domain-containing protein 11A-like [Sycon ciliatum]|uniref:zinc finger CCCH domain-containing protein 11A-like n=1 Tax=Sycon ciliatum TaxID=27933 RepID=UPI0031F629DB